MTEPRRQQSHHQMKTSGSSPSGGSSSGDAPEHLPASQHRAAPQNGDRGRQREENNAHKLWQMKGGQRGVCPAALAAGNELPTHPKPNDIAAGDAAGLDGTLSGQVVREESPEREDTGVEALRRGKKRHRRRNSKKKRNWKPYYKLSWEERKAQEEKETARASRVREEMFAKGLPVAPYNTTQFLMDEHDREEPDLNTEARRPPARVMEDTGSEEDFFDEEDEDDDGSGGGGGGSDGIGRAGSAGGEFLQRDFSETYEMYHVESLQNMTKQELVQEYLELEKCMSRLEEENNRLRRAATTAVEPGAAGAAGGGVTVEGSLLRLRELERELERLRAQNTELLLQNQPGSDGRGQEVATN